MAALVPPPEVPVVVISGANQPPEQIAEHKALTLSSRAGRHSWRHGADTGFQFDEPELIVSVVRELVVSAREPPPSHHPAAD